MPTNSTGGEFRFSRRKLLAAGGSVAALSLAGCAETKRPKSIDESQYKEPTISLPSRWQQEDKIRIPLTVKDVPLSLYTAGQIYTDPVPTSRVSSILPFELDVPLVALFACRVNVINSGIGGDFLYGIANPKRTVKKSEPKLRAILSNKYGISNFKNTESLVSKPEQAKAHREIIGEYQAPPYPQIIELPDGRKEKVEITGNVPVRVFFSSWPVPNSEDLILVGGAYPDTGNITDRNSITGEFGTGIDAEISIDLGINPSHVRQRIVDHLNTVSAR